MLTPNFITRRSAAHVVPPRNPLQIAAPLIKQFEGLSLVPYTCPAGLTTIGYGHVILENENFTTEFSAQEAHLLLLDDITRFWHHVYKLTSDDLNPNQTAALISFTFNVGIGAFRASTLRRKINRRDDIFTIANEFDRWIYAKGKKLKGLVIRRKKEKMLFLSSFSS